jgi:hypothetical protein
MPVTPPCFWFLCVCHADNSTVSAFISPIRRLPRHCAANADTALATLLSPLPSLGVTCCSYLGTNPKASSWVLFVIGPSVYPYSILHSRHERSVIYTSSLSQGVSAAFLYKAAYRQVSANNRKVHGLFRRYPVFLRLKYQGQGCWSPVSLI